jgi:predicted alpha/beta hydrolase family esterase
VAERLRKGGHDVAFPDLPDPFDPYPGAWTETVHRELDANPDVVLCHSLACLLWLRLAATTAVHLAERVLLVAPPSRDDIAPVARFLEHGAGPGDVSQAASATLLVCSNDDPYCPPGAVAAYGEPLQIDSVLIPGAGHINTDAGYGAWPAVEEWAITARWP